MRPTDPVWDCRTASLPSSLTGTSDGETAAAAAYRGRSTNEIGGRALEEDCAGRAAATATAGTAAARAV